MRRLFFALVATFLTALVFACVGDDPTLSPPQGDVDAAKDTSSTTDGADPDSARGDGSVDSGAASCDPSSPFGAPVPVTELNTGEFEDGVSLAADELTVYFTRKSSLYQATRASKTLPFSGVGLVANANQPDTTKQAHLTHDGQVLYTVSTVSGNPVLYYSTFGVGGFSAPAKVSGPSGVFNAMYPYLNAQKSISFYDFPTVPSGGGPVRDAIYTATVVVPGAWSQPSRVEELFSSAGDRSPVLSADQKTLYFASRRNATNDDIYATTRGSITAQWGAPTLLTSLSTPADDAPSWVSDDGCRLYIISSSPGNPDVFLAKRP